MYERSFSLHFSPTHAENLTRKKGSTAAPGRNGIIFILPFVFSPKAVVNFR